MSVDYSSNLFNGTRILQITACGRVIHDEVLPNQVLHLRNVFCFEANSFEYFGSQLSATLRVIATPNIFADIVQKRGKEHHLWPCKLCC
jgi:hypothetical protein